MATKDNKHTSIYCLLIAILTGMALAACSGNGDSKSTVLFSPGCYPNAVMYNGKYYFMKQPDNGNGNIMLYCANKMEDIMNGEHKAIWHATDSTADQNIWAPELHRINGKWYVYFEADDGNTDNHHIYVLENTASDPMQGTFRMKGMLTTNPDWNYGIHPSTFVLNGRQYLVWSGWPKRRSETETQCIYIAGMKNPWTVNTHRVLISQPTYEWERQWINPDGTRSAYPIYVNENPQPVVSLDGKKVAVYYSASGCWTPYTCLGAVYADSRSNLLDSKSWHKAKEPVMMACDSVYAPTDISLVTTKDGHTPILIYETKSMNEHNYIKEIRMKYIKWNDEGLPVFGKP